MRAAVRRLQNIGLLLVTLFLFFGGIETFLRASGLVKMRDYTPPIYARNENPLISYTLKPNIIEKAFRNWVTTDEHGFRTNTPNKPNKPNKPPKPLNLQTSKPLLVLLGDSITFGYGVADDETLPAQLQLLMPETTIINAGVPGYHIGQEVALYEEKIAPMNPDILVIVFYWNDDDLRTSWLDDSGVMRAEGWTPTKKQCEPIDRGLLGLISGKCWLDLNSAFYRAVKEYLNTREAIKERDMRRDEEKKRSNDASPDMNLTLYGEKLREIARIAPERRLFVIWPDESFHDNTRPAIKTIAERNGFVVIDLYDDFGNSMETLDWDYIHPSPQSLSDAASAIYDALKKFLP